MGRAISIAHRCLVDNFIVCEISGGISGLAKSVIDGSEKWKALQFEDLHLDLTNGSFDFDYHMFPPGHKGTMAFSLRGFSAGRGLIGTLGYHNALYFIQLDVLLLAFLVALLWKTKHWCLSTVLLLLCHVGWGSELVSFWLSHRVHTFFSFF